MVGILLEIWVNIPYMGYWDVQIKMEDDEFMVPKRVFDSPALECQIVIMTMDAKEDSQAKVIRK